MQIFGCFSSNKMKFYVFYPNTIRYPFFYSALFPLCPRFASFFFFRTIPSSAPFFAFRPLPFVLRPIPSPCPLASLLSSFSGRLNRPLFSLLPPSLRSPFVRSFPPLRSPPALCIRQYWRIGRRLRSSLFSPISPFPPFPSVHFSRIVARIFSPPFRGSRRGLFSFFISVAYLRQFSSALFPFSSFFFYRQIVFAALLCPLRRDLIPTKTPPKSPFRPENLIILTFSSPKICIYQKKCVPLHQNLGRPLIH